ncbi:tryptophan 7-halogenase [Bacillus sp. MCCB 382]|uniref:NAD(P)/FAD-dependent oxidoreductase n=1 Tax=Bacillus sp. MCCB 382 TaxID=2860197 RepID=UPI001C57D934|nr:tryptophan 7-halogenase [Bacillus sp. MCCB 382]
MNKLYYDVIVVGGGPAGATASALLAKNGKDVLVIEKEVFPRYKIGESLVTGIIPILKELEIYDKVKRDDFIQKYGVTLLWGNTIDPWHIYFGETGPDGGEYDYAFQVERSKFDQILLNNAREKGATVLEGHQVIEFIEIDGRCTGVRYRKPNGEEYIVHAKYIIDASGQATLLARKNKLIEYDEKLKNIAVWSYFEDVEQYEHRAAGNILTENTTDGWIWVIPLANGKTSIGWVSNGNWTKEKGNLNLEQKFREVLSNSIETKRRIKNARQVDSVRTAKDWSYVSKQFYGPGYVLAGDAAGFIDPLFSSGVFLAMNAGSLSAKLINSALDDPLNENEYLYRYEAAYKTFLEKVISFVHYFYDASLDRTSYFKKAQTLVDPWRKLTDREDFIFLISGLAGCHLLADHDPVKSKETELA